jgi:hypothetical protein
MMFYFFLFVGHRDVGSDILAGGTCKEECVAIWKLVKDKVHSRSLYGVYTLHDAAVAEQ